MVQLFNISKTFALKKVLEDINLSINPGSIYCLLGRNGAGKSTMLNIILDLVRPSSGEITIFDRNYEKSAIEIKQMTGCMIESVPIIESMTASDYLMFVGLLYELPKNIILQRIDDLLMFFFDENSILNKNIGTFSTGMKKKIAICASLINKPRLLIWDEPFSGLDPISSQKLVDFIKFYASEERIILISSHDLAYVDKIATNLGILDNSKLVYDGLYTDFTDHSTKSIESGIKDYLRSESVNTSTFSWMTA